MGTSKKPAAPKKPRATKNADAEPVPFSGEPRHLSVCFNSGCADYGRERPAGEPCGCLKKKSVREPMLSIDISQ